MSARNITLKQDATITVADGTDLLIIEDGQVIANGVHLSNGSNSDVRTREQLTIKSRPYLFDSKSQTYGKDKKSLCLVRPIVTASGQISFQTIRIERELHAETGYTDGDEFNKLAAQLLISSALVGFWHGGSLS